jgi:hypothetical protein
MPRRPSAPSAAGALSCPENGVSTPGPALVVADVVRVAQMRRQGVDDGIPVVPPGIL